MGSAEMKGERNDVTTIFTTLRINYIPKAVSSRLTFSKARGECFTTECLIVVICVVGRNT